MLTLVFVFPDVIPNSSCYYFYLSLFFLAFLLIWLMLFKSLSLSESSLDSHASFSWCPPLPPSLIWIVRMYSQNFITQYCWSSWGIFPLCLWLLAYTYSSWNFSKSFFKSIWNVCPEMSSTLFLSFVNSKVTRSLFPVSVTPTLPPSLLLLVRIKSWEALHVFLLHDILLEGLEFQLTILSRSNWYERNLYELLKCQIFTHSLDFYHVSYVSSLSLTNPHSFFKKIKVSHN